MTSFHKSVSTAKKDQEEKKNTAVAKLEQFLLERRGARQPVDDLEEFERELHSLFATAEAEVVGHEVNRFDIDLPFVTVDGIVHQRVLRCEDTYFCASGPVQVMRSLYSTRKDSERAICPMELQAGLVEGRWTPHAAKQATWVVSHLTPGEGEELYGMFGGLKPSKSSLDRLPKQLGQRWERERIEFEDVLRAQERVPAEAVSMAVSLDGVMVPMKNGQRQTKRAQAAEEGKYTRGPAGNKEVGCGTLSFYDEEGERLSTIRMARMPEVKKATLKAMLSKDYIIEPMPIPGTSTRPWRLPMATPIRSAEPSSRNCDTCRQGGGESDPFSRAPSRHVSARKKIARELQDSSLKQSSEPGPCSHIPTRRRLRLSTMSPTPRCQYESYTLTIDRLHHRAHAHPGESQRSYADRQVGPRTQTTTALPVVL